MTTEETQPIVALAARHGLAIDPGSLRYSEAGLDYRVAFARTDDGAEWVLRIPRRADVSAKIADEARILELVSRELTVAVPDWRVHTESLIAYPRLPGEPGLTVSEAGEPEWHFDRESPHYARSFGRLVAELHGIDVERVREAGIPVETAGDVREGWRRTVERVAGAFTIDPALATSWAAWLGDDGLWPEYTVFTHGELYPAHLLLDAEAGILSVLDWTTAKVTDPAVDFAIHHMTSSPEAFQLAVDAYAEVTGRVPHRLEERCAAIAAASPLGYAQFALTTEEPEHAAAAQALLAGG